MILKICPLPQVWNNIYEKQNQIYNQYPARERRHIPQPPVPLILNGWVYSNDIEKYERWRENLLWSIFYSDDTILIRNLSDEEYYYADLPHAPYSYFDTDILLHNNFSNFRTIDYFFRNGYAEIPNVEGVYLVCKPSDFTENIQKTTTAIDEYEGSNLLYETEVLKSRWKPDSNILYIGKSNKIRRRIRQFVRYGYALCDNHRGGRAIWQLDNNKTLLLGHVTTENARGLENRLLQEYRGIHNGLPYANFQE